MSNNTPFSYVNSTTFSEKLPWPSAANVLNPAGATGGVNAGASGQYIVLTHICIFNASGGAGTISFWKGTTGATNPGTEVIASGKRIENGTRFDWYGSLRLDTTDFLVGQSSINGLIGQYEGEVGVSG